jgi:hypothetical protein
MYLFMGQLPNLDSLGLTVFIFGLTVWWFVTMLPFELLVAPALIRGVVRAFPGLVSKELNEKTLGSSFSEKGLAAGLLVPGVLMLIIGATMTYTGLGETITGLFGVAPKNLIEILGYFSGALLSVLGVAIYMKKK